MPTPNELMEQRANVFAQAEDFLARSERGDELSAEDLASWDRANKRAEELKLQAENAQRSTDIKASFEQIDEAAERAAAEAAEATEVAQVGQATEVFADRAGKRRAGGEVEAPLRALRNGVDEAEWVAAATTATATGQAAATEGAANLLDQRGAGRRV